jgi:hypothetical protein
VDYEGAVFHLHAQRLNGGQSHGSSNSARAWRASVSNQPYSLGRSGDRCYSGHELDVEAQGYFDISAHLVHLHPPTFGKISLQFPPAAPLQASIHVVITKSLNEIPMVHQYLDVFPEDLPGMPLDSAIEFKIEL